MNLLKLHVTTFLKIVIILFAVNSPTVKAQPGIDLRFGNAALFVQSKASPIARETWGPGCASIIFRLSMLLGNSWFDAIAPYQSTAVGAHSNLGRRPPGESNTNLRRNIAILYASYGILNSMIPSRNADWRDLMRAAGLDPDNDERNTTTPAGIGNLAADGILAARLGDGMNQLGDEGGCRYNCRPYADYTGYRPVNTAYDLTDPSRWQPYVHTEYNGVYTVQQFVTPQYSITQPNSYPDPTVYSVPPPVASDVNNFALYKEQADAVLAASAALTDETKLQAELFDDKFRGFGAAVLWAARNVPPTPLPLNEFVHYRFTVNLAAWDAGIVAWQEKYEYDAVRPYSAIPHIYGDGPVTAWGGVGQGTVNDLPASEWRQYLLVADHPEYPSGSATFCAAIAQASRKFFGTDTFGWSVNFAPGESTIEPGITPTNPVVLQYPTWTSWEEACWQARVDGGVHFPASTQVVAPYSHEIADLAFQFVQNHINGTP